MAWDDMIDWHPGLEGLWTETFSPYQDTGIMDDPWLAAYFEGAYMSGGLTQEQREGLQEQFMLYVYDTYGIDFESVWDWEAFREAYA